MKELKRITNETDFIGFYEIFEHNKEVVGHIAVRQDVYDDFVRFKDDNIRHIKWSN